MNRPGDVLRGIAARGRKIQADMHALRKSKQGINTGACIAVDALDILFNLSGHKRTATQIARKYGHATADTKIQAKEQEIQNWIMEAKDALRKMTVLRNGIPEKPNSDRLLRGFAASTSLVRPENQLSRGILYLEELSESSVVYNDELPGMLRAVDAIEASSAKKAPSGIEERLALLATNLEGFPSVQEAIKGALEAYKTRKDDWGRQTLGSMRNALESLVKILSGDGDWSTGLAKLVPSDSRRRPIRTAYDFVSNVGPHNKELPDQPDVDFGIGLIERAVQYIIDESRPLARTVKTVKTMQLQLRSDAVFKSSEYAKKETR